MRITSQIYQVGGSQESHPSDGSIFLITNNLEAALIDAGTGRGHDEVIKNILNLGISLNKIKYIFLTHCHYDHTGGAGKLRSAIGCKIVAHELDAIYLEKGNSDDTAASWYNSVMEPIQIDEKIKQKQAIFNIGGIDVRFYHTPGHSPGSSVLTVFSDGNLVLFGQDVHGPLNDVILSNRDEYVKSLEFILSLDADIICEGHFGVFAGQENVREFIESFL